MVRNNSRRIVHLITDLDTGGANLMLYRLLSVTDHTRFKPAVIVLTNKGTLGISIESLGIPVYAVGVSRGQPTPTALLRIVTLLRQLRPDLIQGWMYHGNIAASVASAFVSDGLVLWNIRHTPYALEPYSRLTRLVIRVGGWLSRQPACTIYNSHVSARRHAQLSYNTEHQAVIPNGFDTDEFKPSPAAHTALRHSLGLPDNTLLIGLIARYHPQKDHANFVDAAATLSRQHPNAHFILVGRGVNTTNAELMHLIRETSLIKQVHLLAERSDVAKITAGLDIATLSSAWGEAFPNVVGEAMACGIPCAVTDVGDSAWIVGDTGIVVPPRDPQALAAAWAKLISLGADGRAVLGSAARQRIVSHFSLPVITSRYEELYQEVLARSEARSANNKTASQRPHAS